MAATTRLLLFIGLLSSACDRQSSQNTPHTSALPTSTPELPATLSSAEDAGEDPAAQALDRAPNPGAPLVDFSGVTNLPPPLAPNTPRIAALKWVTPVYSKPNRDSRRLGSLRTGAIVARRSDGNNDGSNKRGCKGGWYAIEPAGYVCAGKDATTELDDPVVRATARRPDYTRRLPYMYGTVTRGGPMYARIPTAKDLKKYEPHLKEHLAKWRDDEVSGAKYGLDVWLRYTNKPTPSAWQAYQDRVTDEDIPWFLRDGAQVPNVSGWVKSKDAVKVGQIDRRTGRSFVYSFLFEGRRYNVTPDLLLVPADRLRPIRGSKFSGWRIGKELDFPFALVRRPGARKWRWDGNKKKMVDGGTLKWRSVVPLQDKKRFYDKKLHYLSKEGFWVDDRHAGRVDPARRWPKWAKNGEKWLDVNITKQVLVAYKGKKAVYATLVSTGEAGLGDPEKTKATTRGIYRIHTKWVTVTMDSDEADSEDVKRTDDGEDFELRDVPYVQYFKEGYALHGAYWHDGFGRPKSHGCINLSPEDARRLFWWTSPHVPVGWHSAAKLLTGTVIFIHP